MRLKLLIIALLFLFSIGSILDYFPLKLIGLLFVFFIPGYILSSLFYKKIDWVERLVYSVAISVPLVTAFAIWLNLVFKLEFNCFFLPILFSSLTLPPLLKLKSVGKKMHLKLGKSDKIFMAYLILSLLIRASLFLKVGTILGADVGRFTSISHILYLKGKITPNLQPYDLASGFFFFPSPFLLPLVMELIGINPIDGVTITTFIFSISSTLVFYLLAKKFLDRKRAISAFFFYSFLFDLLLQYAIFGVFPYAFAIFYFLVLCLISVEIFERKSRFFILILGLTGLFSLHFYLIFPFIAFLFSMFTYEFVNERRVRKSEEIVISFLKASPLAILPLSPYLILSLPYITIPFERENVVDLMSFAYLREKIPLSDRIWNILFVSPVGLLSSGFFIAGFISFLISTKKLAKGRWMILLYFFLYLTIQNFMIFNDLNLSRAAGITWILYSIGLSFLLTNPILNLLILPTFYFVQSPSILYLISILTPIQQPGIIPWVIWPEFYQAMSFIKENTSMDSIFLIDGGGSGCTGASADYGERIFPLTSRRIFYFTDYCWADYNKSDYRRKVDLYRRISIDPDDEEALAAIKNYGVTHVYIGPNHIGLDPKLFLKSPNYELIYNESGFQIFEIK